MQCHYCDAPAAYAAESNEVVVGLCDSHLERQLEEFVESKPLAELKERVELNRQ